MTAILERTTSLRTMPTRDLIRENEILRDRLEAAEQQIRDMKTALAQQPELEGLTFLNARQRLILGILMRKRTASREAIYALVWPNASDGGYGVRVVDTAIRHIRRKLPVTIKIRTVYGEGYALDPEAIQALRDLSQSFVEGRH